MRVLPLLFEEDYTKQGESSSDSLLSHRSPRPVVNTAQASFVLLGLVLTGGWALASVLHGEVEIPPTSDVIQWEASGFH
jgi:hypothetical protein